MSLVQKYKFWLFVIFVVVDFLAVLAFYQTRPVYQITLGMSGDTWYIDNFYAPESNGQGAYRWSRESSTVTLPRVGSPFQVRLDATAYRPTGTPPPTFGLTLSNPTLTASYPGTAQAQTYVLNGPGRPDFRPGTYTLTINAPTFQPSATDDRKLGLSVKAITIQAQPNGFGFVFPPVAAWASLGTGMLLVQVFMLFGFLRLRLKRLLLITTAGGLALPTGILILGLALPTAALENAAPVGVGLFALGLTALSFLRWGRLGTIGGAVVLLGTMWGVFLNLYTFVALAVLVAGAIVLAIIFNPRLNRAAFNLLIVAYIAILPSWGLLQQRFFQTNDGESHHFYWLNELDLMVKEGDFFPGWAPHFSFGRGSTVFSFYPPLSRYLAEFFVLGGLAPAFAFLAFLVCASIAGGLAMYWLSRDFLGGPGAVVAAAVYLYHPYRLSDIYQRGDMAETLNFVFFPLALLVVSRMLRFDRPVRPFLLVGGGVAIGFTIISHQLTAFFFGIFVLAPLILLGLGRFLWKERGTSGLALRRAGIRLLWLAGVAGLGLALSAFYILPVLLESKNIRVGTKASIDPIFGFLDENAINWKEWFSAIEPPDNLNRYTTNLAWIGPLFVVVALLGLVMLWLPGRRVKPENRFFAVSFGLITAMLLFLQLKLTLPFWEKVPGMYYIQFSWRLMIGVSVLTPILIGFLGDWLFGLGRAVFLRQSVLTKRPQPCFRPKSKSFYYLAALGPLFFVYLLLAYSGAGRVNLAYYPPSFNGRYSLGTLINQIDNGDVFYLPVWARSLDKLDLTLDNAYVTQQDRPDPLEVDFKRIQSAHYRLELKQAQPGKLVIPVFYFEGWTLSANGQNIPLSNTQPEGYIQATVPAGNYSLDLRFENSLPRTAGIIVSVLALLLVAALLGLHFSRRPRPLQPGQPLNREGEKVAG